MINFNINFIFPTTKNYYIFFKDQIMYKEINFHKKRFQLKEKKNNYWHPKQKQTFQKKKKKKKWRIILRYLEKFFFKKTFLWFYTCMLFLINFSVLPQSLPIFYIPLSIIYQSFSPYNILYTQFFLNFPRRFSF